MKNAEKLLIDLATARAEKKIARERFAAACAATYGKCEGPSRVSAESNGTDTPCFKLACGEPNIIMCDVCRTTEEPHRDWVKASAKAGAALRACIAFGKAAAGKDGSK
jgi:hypothetical protein